MQKISIYRCPICKKGYKTLSGWAAHMNSDHPENRPEGFSDRQYFYFVLTGKTHGNCVVCKSPTTWNEETGKYNRFCDKESCKEKYRELFKSRMIKRYGKVTLLNDADQQRKMLKGRRISGVYQFPDRGKVDYVGSYEKDFLYMCDHFLHLMSSDIMAPSPHTYSYEYDGSSHFYIPDFYIPNLNLEIEIKDNQSQHPKIRSVDKVKEAKKDEVMNSIKGIRYIKIVDKRYENFFSLLLSLRDMVDDTLNQSQAQTIATEGTVALIPSVLDPVVAEVGDKTPPLNIRDSLTVETPSKLDETKLSSKTKARIEAEKMIQRFPSITAFKRVEKAQELYEFILNNNLDIDLSKYPIISKYLKIYLGKVKKGKRDIPESSNIEPPNQYPNNPEMTDEIPKEIGYVTIYSGKRQISVEDPVTESTLLKNEKLFPVYILLMHSGTALANIIQKFTHDKYSHAAISFDDNLRTFYSFGRKKTGGGFTEEHPNDQFFKDRPKMPLAVYTIFVNEDNYKRMQTKLQYFIDNEDSFRYHFGGLVKIALGKPSENNTHYFCSGFVADILQAGGRSTSRSYTLYKPQDLTRVYASYKVAETNGFDNLNLNTMKENVKNALNRYKNRRIGNRG